MHCAFSLCLLAINQFGQLNFRPNTDGSRQKQGKLILMGPLRKGWVLIPVANEGLLRPLGGPNPECGGREQCRGTMSSRPADNADSQQVPHNFQQLRKYITFASQVGDAEKYKIPVDITINNAGMLGK